MNGIRIFGENWVNGDNDYTFVSGSATEGCLYDQKYDTQWSSSGSSDAIEEIITVVFKNWQGESASRTFDRILILNHNIKAGECEYWDGSAWQDITGAVLAANADTDSMFEIVTPITASQIRLKMTTTQTANQEKAVGEFKVCLGVAEGNWLSDFPREDEQKAGNYRLSGGALAHWKEWTKAGGTLLLADVDKTNLDLLLPLFKTANFITVVFYDDFDLAEVFEFSIVNPPNHKIDRKTELYEIRLELKER